MEKCVPVALDDLVNYTDRLLEASVFVDYCPNGLQVEGRSNISRVVTGVTASAALIDAAIQAEADAIIVHHGFFWKGENPCLSGIKGRRIKKLMQHDISLLAYHLPLDAHSEYGNNVQLARHLDIPITGKMNDVSRSVGLLGELRVSTPADEFAQQVADRLGRQPLLIGGERCIRTVAWCSGAAQSSIEAAIQRKVDCFLTGEVSESTVHMARESGICFIAAGHHATERYGVKALGVHLSQRFGIACEFVDIDNPV